VLLAEIEPMIRKLAEKTWTASRTESRIARTVVLKLKTSDFKMLTRSRVGVFPEGRKSWYRQSVDIETSVHWRGCDKGHGVGFFAKSVAGAVGARRNGTIPMPPPPSFSTMR
jgi:hypothetical protein